MNGKIYLQPGGRMGNAIFRYLAGVLFCALYSLELTDNDSNLQETINDNFFLQWMHEYQTTTNLPAFDVSKGYRFHGYFQHDTIYLQHKDKIFDYIRKHPKDRVRSDNGETIRGIHLLNPVSFPVPSYEIVLHLRLEDFIRIGQAIHPEVIRDFLQKQQDAWSHSQLTIVVKQPTTEMERKYIQHVVRDWKGTVKMESNDMMMDFHIMKNCRILVCSCSTFCWAAALLSDTLEIAYIPHFYHPARNWETFRRPVKDTRPSFSNRECSIYKLGDILGVHVPIPKTRMTRRLRNLRN